MIELSQQAPNLLQVLDAMVRADRGPSGLSGTIAFGLRGRTPRWWVVELDEEARGQLAAQPPEHADAWLALGAAEADAVLGRAPMPDEPQIVTAGDRGLLQRFLRRYVKTLSIVDVRSPGSDA